MEDYPKGQPPKLLKAGVKDRLLFALDKGASYQIACGFAGITYTTLRRWVLRGEEIADLDEEQIEKHPDKIYYDLVHSMREVESSAALKWLGKIDKAAEFHWQAAAWKLERRYPNEYGRSIAEDPNAGGKDGSIEKAKETVNQLKSDNHGRPATTEG